MIPEIKAFLHSETPDAWIKHALKHQDMLLVDHANCEKKAASTAVSLLYRYADKYDLLHKMSRLAREELRHFEQVLKLLKARGINYLNVEPSGYAKSMHQHIRHTEPNKLVDHLIIGAIIEARSCERFAAIAPELDAELQKFYVSLLKSESRHFQDYLALAKQYADEDITERVDFFLMQEAKYIQSPDALFRFHSGVPLVTE